MQRFSGIVTLVLTLVVCVMATPFPQSQSQDDTNGPELLTIDQAIKQALANNRDLKIVSLNLDISKDKVEAAKTHRYPSFNVYTFASQLLSPIAFEVPAGQFGTYPGIGPIPATNTDISTPSKPTAYIFGTISQPLLTLYKINLHVHGEQLSLEQSVQEIREERNSIVNDVRQAYYSVVEIQNVIEAKRASIKQYEELDRITLEYVSEKVALESAELEVKAKLADEKLQLLQAQDKLATAKETLNNLLGRDLNTEFRAAEDKELSPVEQDLRAAQAVALGQNPKIKEAEIKIQQADNIKRLARPSITCRPLASILCQPTSWAPV